MRRSLTLLTGGAAAVLLAGCALLTPLAPQQPPQPQTDPPATPAAGAPAGWEELPHCDGAPEEPWTWVDGFPAAEFEASGASADCGDVWVQDDGETFLNLTSYEMTLEQLDAFGGALEGSGYEKLFDDFTPGTPSGESYYGARDYYLDGEYQHAFTRLAIEIYPSHSADGAWTAYIDFLSPLTRRL
ncbi:MAG TPA: hypothetical protein VNR36_04300 [Pseudolysinimonas sp.]|nr:hypothetical protein [Pseudolysinimonas sp.]